METRSDNQNKRRNIRSVMLMKVVVCIVTIMTIAAISGCTTILPISYAENTILSSENVQRYRVIGIVSRQITPSLLRNKDVGGIQNTGIRGALLQKARNQYGGNVDDVVNLSVTVVSNNFLIFNNDYLIAEGHAIEYQ